MTERPSPLVPADVDLRDFPGMWVDTDRLLRSDTWILGTSDEKAAAFTLWAEAWHQVPAASLPSNDRVLAKLSQAERWKASRAHALRGWVHCSDDRLYHPVVAEKALEAWIKKLAAGISGAVGNAKRWNVKIDTEPLREQFRGAVECLRKLNPASRVLKEKAVALLLSVSGGESGGDSQPESGGDGGAISGGDRKGSDQTRPDQTLRNTEARTEPARAASQSPPGEDAQGQDERADVAGFEPTASGAVCKAMRLASGGVILGNPGDPRLLALLLQGASEAEFVDSAKAAAASSPPKGWGWVLKRVENLRAEAAAMGRAPALLAQPAVALAWHETPAGIKGRGAELGMPWSEDGWVNGEHMAFPTYADRVRRADAKQRREAA